MDKKYPSEIVTDNGLVCPPWSVPLPANIDLEEDVYKNLKSVKTGLDGLDIRYDQRTHTIRLALPRRQADLVCTPETLADNPMVIYRMRDALQKLSIWLSEMVNNKEIIPLIEVIRQSHAIWIEDAHLVEIAAWVHQRWVKGKLTRTLAKLYRRAD
jgi:hypothetical protein